MWGRGTAERRILLAQVAVLALAPGASALAAELTALRHFASPAHTRVVLEFSERLEAKVSTVPSAGPGPLRRIYIDLADTNAAAPVDRMVELADGPLAAIRIGRRDARTVRVVIVVREAGSWDAAQIGGPDRFILDVRAPSGHGPAPRGPSHAGATSGSRADGVAGAHPPRRMVRPGRSIPGPAPSAVADAGKRSESGAGAGLTIVLDPGHGGKDPGATGVGGLREKTVVLALAVRLAERIRRELGARVVLTRERDVFLPLEARTARANAVGADVFVSIHANASTRPTLAGVETYYLNNTDDSATIRLAALENGLPSVGAGGGARDASLSYILSDLVQQGKLEDSIALSQTLHRGLLEGVRTRQPEVVDLGIKRGPFFVLVGAYMPCVLVEVAFLTNAAEAALLGTTEYRDAIAEGLLDGVRAYVAHLRRSRTL